MLVNERPENEMTRIMVDKIKQDFIDDAQVSRTTLDEALPEAPKVLKDGILTALNGETPGQITYSEQHDILSLVGDS